LQAELEQELVEMLEKEKDRLLNATFPSHGSVTDEKVQSRAHPARKPLSSVSLESTI